MFEPLHFIADIPQEQIEVCPTATGVDPYSLLLKDSPGAVVNAVLAMPWTNTRKHRQLLIRPQDCRGVDTRLGTFWHRDVDVHGIVTPTWDDLILTIVSFGGIAETEFIPHRGNLETLMEIWGEPSLSCYTDQFAAEANGAGWPDAVSAAPCQVARYRSWDWHRAGHIRKRGWRLVMIGIESDHLEPRGGVVGR
jgi:hypothetical protein